MEDTAPYVIKCKYLIYKSFVEDSQHSAIAKSIKAAIVAFENDGDRVERRRQGQAARKGEGEGGGQEEESRNLRPSGQDRRRRNQPKEGSLNSAPRPFLTPTLFRAAAGSLAQMFTV